jgi:hypothetical protein
MIDNPPIKYRPHFLIDDTFFIHWSWFTYRNTDVKSSIPLTIETNIGLKSYNTTKISKEIYCSSGFLITKIIF